MASVWFVSTYPLHDIPAVENGNRKRVLRCKAIINGHGHGTEMFYAVSWCDNVCIDSANTETPSVNEYQKRTSFVRFCGRMNTNGNSVAISGFNGNVLFMDLRYVMRLLISLRQFGNEFLVFVVILW